MNILKLCHHVCSKISNFLENKGSFVFYTSFNGSTVIYMIKMAKMHTREIIYV